MSIASAESFRRYRAPHEDGQTLIDPPWPDLPAVVARNRQRLSGVCYDLNGRCLSELSTTARRRLVEQALAYTAQYRDVAAARSNLSANPPFEGTQSRQSEICNPKSYPLILSGHQPQLFHPGVWYKNFVLGSLAREVAGIGIHFLIDSDLCRSVAVRVPAGSREAPRIETVPYDLPGPEVPYEERAIRDRETFASFGERVVTIIKPLVAEPLVKSLWPLVDVVASQQINLGLCLAQGRHQLEASWKNYTLELPQSAVCQMPEFSWFVAHILAHLPRFRTAHNEALAEYRAAHRLRNRAQPVPDLAKADDWLEAPLWMWTSDEPQRRPLFARQSGTHIEISDRGRRTFRLDLTTDGNAAVAAEQLLELASRGIKIRTRALATTLFARLVLGDLFLHGIGGAKYDQVTNWIAREFFGLELPEFAAVSATLRLPIQPASGRSALDNRPQTQLRELRFHPEQLLAREPLASADEMSNVAEIVAAKRRWIKTAKTPQNARQRHLGIAAANAALEPYTAPLRHAIERESAAREEVRRADAILNSREYSYCLYPRSHCERLLLDGPTGGP